MCCVISAFSFWAEGWILIIWWLVNPGRFTIVYNNLLPARGWDNFFTCYHPDLHFYL